MILKDRTIAGPVPPPERKKIVEKLHDPIAHSLQDLLTTMETEAPSLYGRYMNKVRELRDSDERDNEDKDIGS